MFDVYKYISSIDLIELLDGDKVLGSVIGGGIRNSYTEVGGGIESINMEVILLNEFGDDDILFGTDTSHLSSQQKDTRESILDSRTILVILDSDQPDFHDDKRALFDVVLGDKVIDLEFLKKLCRIKNRHRIENVLVQIKYTDKELAEHQKRQISKEVECFGAKNSDKKRRM